jgi:hypothetical protein
MAPEDPRARTVSPRVVCLSVQESVPRTTKSRRGLPALSPDRGSAPSAPTLMVPTGTSSAPGSTWVGTPYRRVAPLPSSTCVIGASAPTVLAPPTPTVSAPPAPTTSAPLAHPAPTPATLVVPGALPSDAKSSGGMVRSPALTTGGTTRDGCAANRWMNGVAKVRRLLPTNHFLSSGK